MVAQQHLGPQEVVVPPLCPPPAPVVPSPAIPPVAPGTWYWEISTFDKFLIIAKIKERKTFSWSFGFAKSVEIYALPNSNMAFFPNTSAANFRIFGQHCFWGPLPARLCSSLHHGHSSFSPSPSSSAGFTRGDAPRLVQGDWGALRGLRQNGAHLS